MDETNFHGFSIKDIVLAQRMREMLHNAPDELWLLVCMHDGKEKQYHINAILEDGTIVLGEKG